jgi:hypothetical protein
MQPHIVLAGDSIFDNAAYVIQKQAVIDLLSARVGGHSKATLLAVDGSVTSEVLEQFEQLPPDTTHLIISSGGNDALAAAHLLNQPVVSVAGAMTLFAKVVDKFQTEYRAMLEEAISRVDIVVVCTIYDSIPGYDKEAMTALKLFNEVILREAFAHNVSVIDLRLICDEATDYSSISPIEPSESGGNKIASMLSYIAGEPEAKVNRPVIYTFANGSRR